MNLFFCLAPGNDKKCGEVSVGHERAYRMQTMFKKSYILKKRELWGVRASTAAYFAADADAHLPRLA